MGWTRLAKLDVPTEWDEPQHVVRTATPHTGHSRPETDGEGLNFDTEPFCSDKMTHFVGHHEDGQDNQERYNRHHRVSPRRPPLVSPSGSKPLAFRRRL